MYLLLLLSLLVSAHSSPAQVVKPLPSVEQVLFRYLEAVGGEAALRKVTTRAAEGTIFVATYGEYGEYREFAKAPRSFRRTFYFPNVALLERGFDGEHGWEENPEYGLESLSGARLSEVRRQAEFHPALTLRSTYAGFTVRGRDRIDEYDAVVLEASTPGGEKDLLWFSETSGLLLAVESTETFSNGVVQRVRYLYEDYRPLDGVQTPCQIRYESPRLIWVVTRKVAHNVPIEDSVFLMPDGQ
jgi:hypothetical protein